MKEELVVERGQGGTRMDTSGLSKPSGGIEGTGSVHFVH